MKIVPEQRRLARQLAMQALYQWSISGDSLTDLEQQYSARTEEQAVDWDYFLVLLRGVLAELEDLDRMIAASSSFEPARLSKVELAILRLGAFEIARRMDVPFRAAINESLEIAKTFGAEGSFRYINAVLDSLAARLRRK